MGKTSKKIITDLKNHWQEVIISISTIIYFVYYTLASIIKYDNYYAGRFDLGNMTQTVWNTLHGNFFMLTDPNGTEEISRLAFHADFILALFAPLYLLWEDPRVLLIIQTFVLSLGGIFVFLIAKEILKNKTLALFFGICFLLSPAVGFTNLFDFHSVTLATTFLLAAFYFMIRKHWVLFVISLILAGITKEQVWAINALFGLYLIFISKQKVLGTIITASSAFIFYLLFWVAIPKAAGDHHFALEFYSDYGTSTGDVMKNIILNPIKTIEILLLPDRLDYIKKLFMPLGYLSFLAFPFLIFASPDLMINLISNSPQMHQIYYQYSATVTPFIFIAAIYGVKLLLKKFPEIPYQAICFVLLIFTMTAAYNYGPLPFAKKPNNIWYKKPLVNRAAVDNYLVNIPLDKKVSASNNLGSHLSHRRFIYVIPNGFREADMILFLLQDPSKSELKIFDEVSENKNFTLEFKDNNFYVFKKINP